MVWRPAIACLVLLALVLVPVLGLAGDDSFGVRRTGPHETGLRHPPLRAWRTPPAVAETRIAIPVVVVLASVDPSEPSYSLPLVSRTPFVPPRD